MRTLKSIKDFQNENQGANSDLDLAKVIGGRTAEDCTCTENWPTDGGCDTDRWVYLDTSNGKKYLSNELIMHDIQP